MRPIPKPPKDIEIQQLRVLDVLLRERSLTRAAEMLDTTQPTVSKILATLRRVFDDPLFVRVSLRMEPTAKALELEPAVRALLDQSRTLLAQGGRFEPRVANRIFRIFLSDGGVVLLLPRVMQELEREAPGVQLRVLPLQERNLLDSLETGEADLAVGAFPSLLQNIRRQRLYAESYVCVARKKHPRVADPLSRDGFVAERHVIVSGTGTGHSFQIVERALEPLIPQGNIVLRVPMLVAAAIVAKHSDAIATLPRRIATLLASELDLQVVGLPIDLPQIEIAQYWHERFHRDSGNRWLRSLFHRLFGETTGR